MKKSVSFSDDRAETGWISSRLLGDPPRKARTYRVEVTTRQAAMDLYARRALQALRKAGLPEKAIVRSVKVYAFSGHFDFSAAEHFARDLLCDPVAEMFSVNRPIIAATDMVEVEIARHWDTNIPTEPVAHRAARLHGLELLWFRPARRWLISGFDDTDALTDIIERALANPAVEEISVGRQLDLTPPPIAEKKRGRREVPMLALGDESLIELSRTNRLGLNLEELRVIQARYRREGREPTDIELDTFAQAWSEHCSHKTLRGPVRHVENGGSPETFRDLLGETIHHATRKLAKPWCFVAADGSGDDDSVGIVSFDDEYALTARTETRNRPSAVDPRNGAAIAFGGSVRDTLAAGLGSEPIMSFAAMCVGDPTITPEERSAENMAPERVLQEGAIGIAEYARIVGLPVAVGRVVTDAHYAANPLVVAGTIALTPLQGMTPKGIAPGLLGITLGGRTGREGAHGALLASSKTSVAHNKAVAEAVPSWYAVETEKLMRVVARGREEGLWESLANVGAGGYAATFAKLAGLSGARVDIDRIPARHAGVTPLELWIGESEERMAAAVTRANWPRVREIAAEEEVEAAQVALFTDDGQLTLNWNGDEIGRIDLAFLRQAAPRMEKVSAWKDVGQVDPEPAGKENYDDELKALLMRWESGACEKAMRQGDVILPGTGVVGPLSGVRMNMSVDACVVAPLHSSRRGISVSLGLCPRYSDLDPYLMAANVIDEALLHLVAVGGDLERSSLLYNLCWGDCSRPERMGRMVRALKGCRDYSLAFGVPFVSGRESLNNEFEGHSHSYSIPDTLLATAFAPISDIGRAITPDLKAAGNSLFMAGVTHRELGGSYYYTHNGVKGGQVPRVNAEQALKTYRALAAPHADGWIRSMMACIIGGVAVTAARMSMAGGLGLEINLDRMPKDEGLQGDTEALLFSESASRLLIEVDHDHVDAFAASMDKAGVPVKVIGVVATLPKLSIRCGGKPCIDAPLTELQQVWRNVIGAN